MKNSKSDDFRAVCDILSSSLPIQRQSFGDRSQNKISSLLIRVRFVKSESKACHPASNLHNLKKSVVIIEGFSNKNSRLSSINLHNLSANCLENSDSSSNIIFLAIDISKSHASAILFFIIRLTNQSICEIVRVCSLRNLWSINLFKSYISFSQP